MKLILNVCLFMCLLLVHGCGPVPEQAEATVGITPNIKTDACATNFSRATPNFCLRIGNVLGDNQALIADNNCRSVSFTSIPSTINYILMDISASLYSNNTTTVKQIVGTIYSNASCTAIVHQFNFSAYEFVATAANTFMQNNIYSIMVPISSQLVYYKASLVNSPGSSSGISFAPTGYYD